MVEGTSVAVRVTGKPTVICEGASREIVFQLTEALIRSVAEVDEVAIESPLYRAVNA